jgi:hypothetical protein
LTKTTFLSLIYALLNVSIPNNVDDGRSVVPNATGDRATLDGVGLALFSSSLLSAEVPPGRGFEWYLGLSENLDICGGTLVMIGGYI